MELVKIVNKKKTYVDKQGVTRNSVHLYVCAELEGKRVMVAVKPAFADSKKDYFLLDALATTKVIEDSGK